MSEKKSYRAGVVGVGAMGRYHVRNYAEMDAVDLVAICDTDTSARERISGAYKLKTYADHIEMAETERLDVVSVVVPTHLHAQVSCDLLERGVHVLVEKPIASTVEQGQGMIEAARKAGTVLMVGHVEHFNPAINEIRKRLARSELGKVFQIHARRLSPFPLRITDVGVILDLASHDIEVMRHLVDSDVARVFAEVAQKAHALGEDLLSGLLRFENGVIGVLDVNWLTPTKVRQLTILGENGMYLADYITQDVFWYQNSQMMHQASSRDVFRGVWEGDMIKVRVEKREPLREELDAFLEAVRGHIPVPVSGEDGLDVLSTAKWLVESGVTHAPIEVEHGR